MNIPQIRDAIRDVLAPLDVHVYDTVPLSPNVPCVIVQPDEPFISYNEAMGKGLSEVRFVLTALTSLSSPRAGQDQLDKLLSSGTSESGSIVDLLEVAQSFGGLTNHASVVTSVTNYTGRTFGEPQATVHLGADIHLIVWSPRT